MLPYFILSTKMATIETNFLKVIRLNSNNNSELFMVASRFSLDISWYMSGWIAKSSFIGFVGYSIYVYSSTNCANGIVGIDGLDQNYCLLTYSCKNIVRSK